eukprot:TRINITY_DN2379_c0_g1_i1.p1 TRINITY_DN2379_c0_g1~~TRINITY_DN2379_c0_g1_i1.p1  ORF type:complete len:173 (-),score=25.52 TRINITY_DN2379_c0_g1_i1:46-564(-)
MVNERLGPLPTEITKQICEYAAEDWKKSKIANVPASPLKAGDKIYVILTRLFCATYDVVARVNTFLCLGTLEEAQKEARWRYYREVDTSWRHGITSEIGVEWSSPKQAATVSKQVLSKDWTSDSTVAPRAAGGPAVCQVLEYTLQLNMGKLVASYDKMVYSLPLKPRKEQKK